MIAPELTELAGVEEYGLAYSRLVLTWQANQRRIESDIDAKTFRLNGNNVLRVAQVNTVDVRKFWNAKLRNQKAAIEAANAS